MASSSSVEEAIPAPPTPTPSQPSPPPSHLPTTRSKTNTISTTKSLSTTFKTSTTQKLSNLKEFTSYIPLRLSPSERSLLTVLESTLHVSEYTDNIDVASNRYGGTMRSIHGKARKILDGILEGCHVATGLCVGGMLDSPLVLKKDGIGLGASNKSTAVDSRINGRVTKDASSHTETDNSNSFDLKMAKRTKQAAKAKKKEEKRLRKLNSKSKSNSNHDDAMKRKKKKSKEKYGKVMDDCIHSTSTIGISSHSRPPPNNDLLTNIAKTTNDDDNEEEEEEDMWSNVHSIASLTPLQNSQFFQTIFEIGRRNKVLNPSKMRDTYGKLMHLLQDAQAPTIAKSLGFSLYKDMVMVRPFLEERGIGDILEDERLLGATEFIGSRDEITGKKVERSVIDKKVQRKNQLMEELLDEYSELSNDHPKDNGSSNNNNKETKKCKISRSDLKRCIDSISDANSVVESNVAPVKRMLHLLECNFSPHKIENPFSLELRGRGGGGSVFSSSSRYGGYGFGAFGSSSYSSSSCSGPTLSHSHSTQYTFVWQSLNLWAEVQRNMHKLWVCADQDLLSTSTSYQLLNTGQGLNRVQSCPRVAKVMRALLHKTQKAANSSWVGLSVIHLGDRDVPNALVFIDKYTQIPRFLKPVADFCDGIEDLCQEEAEEGQGGTIRKYVENQFGSKRNLKMTVLSDYFKHGFDGSGDDGGSCIDGRLTSSWNWTSRIAKKNYYHAFMLSGFQGFDGDFK